MTNREKAQGLYDVMVVGSRTRAERLAAWDEMADLLKSSKASFAKLTGSELDFKLLRQEIEALPEGDPLDEPTSLVQDQAEGKPLDPAKAKAHVDGAVRGLITAEVRRLLLETEGSYPEIVAAVRALHPEAVTTARSVASVASEMRKAGQAVSLRRKEASK